MPSIRNTPAANYLERALAESYRELKAATFECDDLDQCFASGLINIYESYLTYLDVDPRRCITTHMMIKQRAESQSLLRLAEVWATALGEIQACDNILALIEEG